MASPSKPRYFGTAGSNSVFTQPNGTRVFAVSAIRKRLKGAEDKEEIELAGCRLLECGLPVMIEDRSGGAVITCENVLEGR